MFEILLGSLAAGLMVIVLVGLYVLNLRLIVPANEVHIVQRTHQTMSYGKDTDNGNVYYKIPSWVPKLGVVVSTLPSTIVDVTLDRYEAYDKDRLPFVVDIKAFFRIEDFGTAASRVYSIKELIDQLTSIVQGAARSILAKEYLEDIMSKRSEYGEEFTNEVASQLKEWGVVTVKNIELMDIKDGQNEEVISNIMKKKKSAIEMETRIEVAKNAKLAQESEIQASQEVKIKKQESDRLVGLQNAQVEQEVGIAQQKQKQQIQAETKVTAEKEMEVKRVREVQAAEIEKSAAEVQAAQGREVARVKAEEQIIQADAGKQVKVVEAEAQKEQTVLQAEAVKYQVELKAAADLTAASNEAKGIDTKGKALASAKDLMEKALISGQIELFTKVNKDKDYQQFLLQQRQVEACEAVGKEQAKALSSADIKIFANSASASDGLSKAAGTISSQKGLDLSSMLESFTATPMGEAVVSGVLNKLAGGKDKEDGQ